MRRGGHIVAGLALLLACNGGNAVGGDSGGTTTEVSTTDATGAETDESSTGTESTDTSDTEESETTEGTIFDLGDPGGPEGPFSTYAMTCNGGDVLATERLLIDTQNGLQCPGSPYEVKILLTRWPDDPGSVLDPGVQDLAERGVVVDGEYVDATGTLEVEDLGGGDYVGTIDAMWDGGSYAGDFTGMNCGDDSSDCWGGN
jgi:hypothetical protein